MERILVVAFDFPYPLNHGAVIDIWGHVQTLKKLGFKVDLAVTVKTMPSKEHIDIVKEGVNQLWLVERQRDWKAAVAFSPFQVRSRARLQTLALSDQYSAVLLQAEHVSAILENPNLHAARRILRLQNNEARLFRDLGKSSKNVLHKVFYNSEALKFRALSPSIMAKCDALWFISDYEMREHLKKFPHDSAKSFFVPPAVDVTVMRSQPLEGHKVLFVGTLAFPPNASGVEWYVANAHPLLRDVAGYSFVVAGNTAGSPDHALARLAGLHPNVTLHKNPKSTESLYQDAAVFVNPIFRGAGLKLKIVNAIQAGMPIVSTTKGIEGTGLVPGKHLLVADCAASFAACVRSLLNDKAKARELVASAQAYIGTEYDQERVIRRSLSTIL